MGRLSALAGASPDRHRVEEDLPRVHRLPVDLFRAVPFRARLHTRASTRADKPPMPPVGRRTPAITRRRGSTRHLDRPSDRRSGGSLCPSFLAATPGDSTQSDVELRPRQSRRRHRRIDRKSHDGFDGFRQSGIQSVLGSSPSNSFVVGSLVLPPSVRQQLPRSRDGLLLIEQAENANKASCCPITLPPDGGDCSTQVAGVQPFRWPRFVAHQSVIEAGKR